MDERGGELVATNEPAIDTEPSLDTVIVEDGESDTRLANSTSTDESKRTEFFCQADELFDQLVSSEEISRWWWR